MNMMRRLKSIASGCSSVSDPGGDSSTKRVKVEQEFDQRFPLEVDTGEKCVRAPETLKHVNSSEAVASTSNGHGRTENSGHGVLPKEMNQYMLIPYVQLYTYQLTGIQKTTWLENGQW